MRNAIQDLARLWGYRRRLSSAVAQQARSQYKGSVLGLLWIVIFPLLQLTVLAVLYVFILRVRPPGLSEWEYVLHIFAGLVPLLSFSAMLSASVSSLYGEQSLLLNTVFPADLIVVRTVLASQIPGLVGLGTTITLGFVVGGASWLSIVLTPIAWILLTMFVTGIGWILSLVSLIAKDIQHALGIVLMLITLLSPFAYTAEMVPSALKPLIIVNPLSYFVFFFQDSIAYGRSPTVTPVFGTLVLGIGMFFIGLSVFTRSKHIFFDHA